MLLLLFLLALGANSQKIVTTSYGELKGVTQYSSTDGNHKYTFKSVPFAKPPVGNLRFALPLEPEPWTGILDASNYSAACMSNSTLTGSPQHYISENCLYVNIFTSEECLNKKCPVIIYYHGGAFNLDSATMFPDDFILERYVGEGVVFVIPAYRLGVLGQLYFGPSNLLSENVFMFDIVKSLHYVHNEISNFGGDPNQVTIMGHSTGGTIVDALGFSDLIDPEMKLFQKLIALSAPGLFAYMDLMVDNSFNFAERIGCWPGNTTQRSEANIAEILKCLREKPASELLTLQRELESNKVMDFRGLIKGAPFMKFQGKIADLKKNASPRKMICGVTEHEFRTSLNATSYTPGEFIDFDHPRQVYAHFDELLKSNEDNWKSSYTAGIFLSAATYSEALVNAGGEAYLFETRQKPYSFHVSDMQYFIGIHREVHHRPDMDILDSFYSQMLVNFTKFGEPSPNWEAFDPTKMNYLALEVDTKLGIGPEMKNDFHELERDIWLVDMVQYDQNLTEMITKQASLPLPNNSTEPIIEMIPKEVIIFTPFIRSTTYTSILGNENLQIFKQWWFYLILVAIALFVILLVVYFRKKNTEELIPLIA